MDFIMKNLKNLSELMSGRMPLHLPLNIIANVVIMLLIVLLEKNIINDADTSRIYTTAREAMEKSIKNP